MKFVLRSRARIRRALRDLGRSHHRDLGFAAFWAVIGLLLWLAGATGIWGNAQIVEIPSWGFLIFLGIAVICLTQRSKRPFWALAIVTLVTALDLLAGGSVGVLLIFTDLVYAAVRYGRGRVLRPLLRIAAVGWVALLVTLLVAHLPHEVLALAIQWSLIVLVSGLWGWNVRSEGVRIRALVSAEHERETRLLRDRIAHELHDRVANQIAVAGLHIEAAKLQLGDPAADRAQVATSLDRAKSGTEHAHAELRELITVLTAAAALDEEPHATVSSQIARISVLPPAPRRVVWVGAARDTISTELAALSDVSQQLVIRVLHELITNAVKHGAGDVRVRAHAVHTPANAPAMEPATVATAGGMRELRIHIENDLADADNPKLASSGLGLGGARLLLRSLGGTLRVGPGAPDAPGTAQPEAAPQVWLAEIILHTAARPTSPRAQLRSAVSEGEHAS